MLGLVGLYRLLRELGASPRDALTGVALVGFYPVYFILSFTFMTDIPFIAAMIWTFFSFVHALRTRRDLPLVAAAVFACLAIGIRPIGIVLPGAMLAGLLFHSGRWGLRAHRLLFAAAPVAVLALLTVAREDLTAYRADITWMHGSPAWRLAYLEFGIPELSKWLAVNLTFVAGTLGIALGPIALGGTDRGTVLAIIVVASVVGVVFLVALFLGWDVSPPLAPGFTWSLRQIGATEEFLGPADGPTGPSWWTPVSMVGAVLLFSIAIAPLLRHRPRAEGGVLVWAGAGYFTVMAVLWFFYDRYALPLLPILVALRIGTQELRRARRALVGVAVLGAISVLGTWDHLRYSEAMWAAVDWLRDRGVAERDIDGGYVVNGWLQYAHPERANRAPNGDVLVPGINVSLPATYTLRNTTPTDNRVLHTVPYRRLLSRSGRIYIWERSSVRGEGHSSRLDTPTGDLVPGKRHPPPGP